MLLSQWQNSFGKIAVSDFSGADPLIHRRNVSKLLELGIRTERNDVKFLNEPQFAGSFKDEKVSDL